MKSRNEIAERIKLAVAEVNKQKEKARKDLRNQGIFVSKKASKKGLKKLEKVKPRNKVNRNAPCACGSGKKFKNCCIWT